MSRRTRTGRYYPEPSPFARGVMRHLAVSLATAAVVATVFTAWKPAALSPSELAGQLAAALEGKPTEQPVSSFLSPGSTDQGDLKIGIVVGHSGPNPDTGYADPGAQCRDGLTELMINQAVGDLVKGTLEAAGLKVDLLEEWDDRLIGYRGVALVSIHTDSCEPSGEYATGYKVAAAVETKVQDKAQRLVACMIDRYGRATDLRYHPYSITIDMTEYHTFREIHPQTPAVIIEVGFMYLDREFLTKHTDLVARGISDGILCYVNNEPADLDWED
ncbi:MAG TPA: N-acetylmuramoyl-L-alanine amidase [Anaerolineae bacterium]|nr:N-acetylmuramoyl-L-alanine amidase [Anaerolineae bacterium]